MTEAKNPATAPATAPVKEKHDCIDYSVRELNFVLNRLYSLRDKIDGGDESASVGVGEEAQCLSSVLNNTPSRILGFIDSATGLIDDIEERLF